MLLSDVDIAGELLKGTIQIDYPVGRRRVYVSAEAIQPASVDLRLGSTLLVFPMQAFFAVDDVVGDPESGPSLQVFNLDKRAYELDPGEFVLGVLHERVAVNNEFAAQIAGKSSIARRGISVHETAGFVDPGWDGYLTLEIRNNSPYVYKLHHKMWIAQIQFWQLRTPARRTYNGKYQGADTPMASLNRLNYPTQVKKS